jgi:hypothetical protein
MSEEFKRWLPQEEFQDHLPDYAPKSSIFEAVLPAEDPDWKRE